MFSRCWHSRFTRCLRVLPLDWRRQAAMSGQCLLPSLPTSLSSPSQIVTFSPFSLSPSPGSWSPSASAWSCCRPAPAQSGSASPSSPSPLSGLSFSPPLLFLWSSYQIFTWPTFTIYTAFWLKLAKLIHPQMNIQWWYQLNPNPDLLSPMGIGIGMAISELSSSDSQLIVSIFQVPNTNNKVLLILITISVSFPGQNVR